MVCSSVGIMLCEGWEVGSCDCVGRNVGPVNVGLGETDGGSEGASLGSDSSVILVENPKSRDLIEPVSNTVPTPFTSNCSDGVSKK